jgi:hypothetical protein
MALHSSRTDGWISIRKHGGGLQQRGQASFFKGYRISSNDDGMAPDVYVQWHWDGHTLRVETCETGFLPTFIYFNNLEVAVATRVTDLFDHSGLRPSLDQEALSVFFRLGFFVGNATPFKDVQILGPNGRFVWEPDGQQLQDGYPDVPCTTESPDHALESYVELFRSAIASIVHHVGDRCAVPLSGGRDSRHIALELFRLGVMPHFAVTAHHLPPRADEDVHIARILCEHLNWQHKVVEQPKNWFNQQVSHIEVVDYLSYEHSWTLPIKYALSNARIKQAFDGVGGDVLSAGLFQENEAVILYERNQLADLAIYLINFWRWLGGEEGMSRTFGPALSDASKTDTAIEVLRTELTKHLGQPNPLKSFYFWNRSRRGTGLFPFRILADLDTFAPYLAPKLRTFLLSLPHSITADKTFHSRAIIRADSRIGSLPYEDKEARSEAIPRLQAWIYALELSRRCMRQFSTSVWRPSFVLPRVGKSALLANLNTICWWNPRRVVYLSRLERFLKHYCN